MPSDLTHEKRIKCVSEDQETMKCRVYQRDDRNSATRHFQIMIIHSIDQEGNSLRRWTLDTRVQSSVLLSLSDQTCTFSVHTHTLIYTHTIAHTSHNTHTQLTHTLTHTQCTRVWVSGMATSCVPWEKFMRAMHIPFSINFSRVSTELQAGPRWV